MAEFIQVDDLWINTESIQRFQPIQEGDEIVGLLLWVNGIADCMMVEDPDAVEVILKMVGSKKTNHLIRAQIREFVPEPPQSQQPARSPNTSVHSLLISCAYHSTNREQRKHFSLTKEQDRELENLEAHSSDRREQVRYRTIRLLGGGARMDLLARTLNVSIPAIKSWVVLYLAFGAHGLKAMSDQERNQLMNQLKEQKR